MAFDILIFLAGLQTKALAALGRIDYLGDRTICVFFGANETSICRYSLAFIFSEIIFES